MTIRRWSSVVAQSNNVPVVGMFTFCCGLLLRTPKVIETNNNVWDHSLPPSSSLGELPGMYITNPDSSFHHGDISEDKPQLLYQTSQRSAKTLWNHIKEDPWYYLTLYVSHFCLMFAC